MVWTKKTNAPQKINKKLGTNSTSIKLLRKKKNNLGTGYKLKIKKKKLGGLSDFLDFSSSQIYLFTIKALG